MIPNLPLILALAVSLPAAGGAWLYQANKYERLLTEQRLEFSRAHITALEVAHAETIRLQEQSSRAQAAAAARQRALAADRDRLYVAADGLRDQTSTARERIPSATPAATTEYAAAASELLDQCASAYSDLAGKAQGHADDARILLDAWPRRED